jgi:hypothetical protein
MKTVANRLLRFAWRFTLGPLAMPVMRAIEKAGGFNC